MALLSKHANQCRRGDDGTFWRLAVDVPKPEEMHLFSMRLRAVDTLLQPATPDVVRALVGTLRGMKVKAAQTDADADTTRSIYNRTLVATGLPEFAIAAAVNAAMEGSLNEGNRLAPKWLPDVGELCVFARREVASLIAHRAKLGRVVFAQLHRPIKPSSIEERRRIIAEARRRPRDVPAETPPPP